MVLKPRKGYDLREVDPSLPISSNKGGMRPDMEQENLWKLLGERAFCNVRNLRTASYLISLFISDGQVCPCVGRAVDREACMGRMVPVLQVNLGAYEECS